MTYLIYARLWPKQNSRGQNTAQWTLSEPKQYLPVLRLRWWIIKREQKGHKQIISASVNFVQVRAVSQNPSLKI